MTFIKDGVPQAVVEIYTSRVCGLFSVKDCIVDVTQELGGPQLAIIWYRPARHDDTLDSLDLLSVQGLAYDNIEQVLAAGLLAHSVVFNGNKVEMGTWMGRSINHSCASNAKWGACKTIFQGTATVQVDAITVVTETDGMAVGDEVLLYYSADYFEAGNHNCRCVARCGRGPITPADLVTPPSEEQHLGPAALVTPPSPPHLTS